jgi:hypothetical protein
MTGRAEPGEPSRLSGNLLLSPVLATAMNLGSVSALSGSLRHKRFTPAQPGPETGGAAWRGHGRLERQQAWAGDGRSGRFSWRPGQPGRQS